MHSCAYSFSYLQMFLITLSRCKHTLILYLPNLKPPVRIQQRTINRWSFLLGVNLKVVLCVVKKSCSVLLYTILFCVVLKYFTSSIQGALLFFKMAFCSNPYSSYYFTCDTLRLYGYMRSLFGMMAAGVERGLKLP